MQQRYQNLIEDVSATIAERLFEDADWLEKNHRLEIDALTFQLMMAIGLAVINRLFGRLRDKKVQECRDEGMCIWDHKEDTVEWRTLLGTAQINSPYMRDQYTGQSARPMKDIFEVEGKKKTQALKRALSDFGSEDSYEDAESRFEEHYGFHIGRTSILRVTNKVGQQAERYLEERLEDYQQSYESPSQDRRDAVSEFVAELDGSAVRCGEYMTARQAGLTSEDGYEPDDRVRDVEWKEVRVGLVRRSDERSKKYVCRMGDYDDICKQMFGLAVSLGLTPGAQVISPGDGGNGLMEALDEWFDNLQFILDYSHLKTHFYETAEALGIGEDMRDGWVETFLDRIWEGQVDKVIQRLESLYEDDPNNRLDRLIRYLERFSDCVDYSDYEEAGWPTGSGEVESAHKYLPQDRLKLPGACWKPESINPMMAIRVIKKNGWWDDFWDWQIQQQEAA
jgi:hypothetical protein